MVVFPYFFLVFGGYFSSYPRCHCSSTDSVTFFSATLPIFYMFYSDCTTPSPTLRVFLQQRLKKRIACLLFILENPLSFLIDIHKKMGRADTAPGPLNAFTVYTCMHVLSQHKKLNRSIPFFRSRIAAARMQLIYFSSSSNIFLCCISFLFSSSFF